MQNFELISFASADELAATSASAWLDEIAAANHAARPHCVALSGGRIALKFFTSVVAQTKAREISLGLVHFFWADERCVPPDDAESNFRAAHELLFAPLRINDAQIHRIHGEDSPEIAAQKATMDICHVAPKNSAGQPVLDLIFLGMGEDGHVASLFPGKMEGTNARRYFLCREQFTQAAAGSRHVELRRHRRREKCLGAGFGRGQGNGVARIAFAGRTKLRWQKSSNRARRRRFSPIFRWR